MKNTCHYTAPLGWMNDPNGLIFYNGTYHVFYQYYPDDIKWGPMHWGHAVTTDLMHWEDLPIALSPDEKGYIFSGSGVVIEDDFYLFYTAHDPESGEECQCLAVSKKDSDHRTFAKIKYDILNKKCRDFRDPKVFANPVKGGYAMAVGTEDSVEFYVSDDLLDWNLSGSFRPKDGIDFPGWKPVVFECPDCIQIGQDWVLVSSVVFENEKGDTIHRALCFIGTFDGDSFTGTFGGWMDHGPDYYAPTSFYGSGEHAMMAWAENWDIVYEIPALVRRGRMTMLRTPRVEQTENGKRLAFSPVLPENRGHMIDGFQVNRFEMNVGESAYLYTADDIGLLVTLEEDRIIVDRSECPITGFSPKLRKAESRIFTAKRERKGTCELIVTEEDGLFEIYGDGGLSVFTIRTR